MAEVFKAVIGRLTGALGNMVFRNHEDVTTITMRPRKYEVKMTEAIIQRRERFALTGSFSMAINRDANLKYTWEKVYNKKKRIMTTIFKENYKHITYNNISNAATLAPPLGIGISKSASTLTGTDVSVTLEPIGTKTKINLSSEVSIYMTALIYCKTPVIATEDPFKFVNITSSSIALSLTNPLTFEVELQDTEMQIYDMYSEHTLFAAFFTLNDIGVPVNYTNTIKG